MCYCPIPLFYPQPCTRPRIMNFIVFIVLFERKLIVFCVSVCLLGLTHPSKYGRYVHLGGNFATYGQNFFAKLWHYLHASATLKTRHGSGFTRFTKDTIWQTFCLSKSQLLVPVIGNYFYFDEMKQDLEWEPTQTFDIWYLIENAGLR